jgi:16S rRNA (adenine1518-N6/adenine1519-N6)-dimethyltransferase
MTAHPGQEGYSSFSILIAGVYRVKALMTMGGSAFYPPPRVDSLGLRLDLREDAQAVPPSPLFYTMVRRLFSKRRKTVKNSLCSFVASYGIIKAPEDLAMAALEGCGIRPEERPEHLDISQFRDLALRLQNLGVGE